MKITFMLRGIKNIIFDLGGVIYDVDYTKTIKAFEDLGISDFDRVYAKAGQSDLFDNLETGAISVHEFYSGINSFLQIELSEEEINHAWNAMLLHFMPEAIKCIKGLKSNYRLFLLSNTNHIHIESIKRQYGVQYFEEFSSLFEKVYLSHDLGLRKPHKNVFDFIVNEQGLIPEQTLFVDDSPQHVEGAVLAGLNAYHLKDGEKISELL